MAQIEEVQFVHWGSMRPDVTPLAAPGITMLVGPNGSGKTCCLDGIKVLLGVADLGGVRTPASYIFDGGPSGLPADQAWLRGTFANPASPGQRHRVFAVAGDGCQDAEHVTVICRVQGDKRRYLVLPGRIAWGRGEQQIRADLEELLTRYPESRWRGPQQYDDLLDRVGITKALRGVLALPQGQTDRLVSEAPTGLMRRLLDLTGRQATLDQFRIAQSKHDEAVITHQAAERKFAQKESEVKLLEIKVQQHREWDACKTQMREIDDVLLPAAGHFEVKELLEQLKGEIARAEDVSAEMRRTADGLLRECEEDASGIDALVATVPGVSDEVEELKGKADAAVETVGRLRERAGGIWRSLQQSRSLVVGITVTEASAHVEESEKAFVEAFRHRIELAAESSRYKDDHTRLSGEGSMAPREVHEFCRCLRDLGCTPTIVGDALADAISITEIEDAARVQAALGDALWGVSVPDSQYQTACREAVAAGLRWPIVRQGKGSPEGVLAINGPSFLGQLLEELDGVGALDVAAAVPLLARGQHAVTVDGMRYGPTLARLAPERRVVLHAKSRERLLKEYIEIINRTEGDSAGLVDEIGELRVRLQEAYFVRDAARRREELRSALRDACVDLVAARAARDQARAVHLAVQHREGELKRFILSKQGELSVKKGEHARLDRDANDRQSLVKSLRERRAEREIELSETPLPIGFTSAHQERLEPKNDLTVRRRMLSEQIDDRVRYPADIRDPLIVGQWDAERERLLEVSELIQGKSEELASRAALLAEARSRYDNHIRALVRELRNRFVEICAIARIDGDIRLIPGDTPDDYGVDVLVAHKEGEAPVSYRVAGHSGGQRTKIAILLLLAAMSLGRTADLLIVDEHQAHLDGTNSDQIVAIMRNLAERAQFILSAPSSGRGDDAVSWCDLQITFLPRNPGALHSPPLRLMSRMGARQFEQRFVSAQQELG